MEKAFEQAKYYVQTWFLAITTLYHSFTTFKRHGNERWGERQGPM